MPGADETLGPDTGMTEAYGWEGRELIDHRGETVGTIEGLYRDERTARPEWATVRTGLFGTKQTFVPIGMTWKRYGLTSR